MKNMKKVYKRENGDKRFTLRGKSSWFQIKYEKHETIESQTQE